MTNAEFLSFMFDNAPKGAMPLGCSFLCSPEDKSELTKYKWKSQPLIVGADPMVKGHFGTAGKFTPETNNYVSVSSFLPTDC